MATIAATKPVHPSPVSGRYDRFFYSCIAFAMLLTVLIGFAPTYYLRLTGSEPMKTFSHAPFTRLVHVHGALFTSWVLLFVVQTALVARRHVAVHRKLGVAGGFLASAMVIVGVTTAIHAAARGSAPPGVSPIAFLAVPLGDMFLFALFVGMALWYRRDKEAHKRLMLLGYVSIMAAAVARWPGVLPLGPFGFFGLTFLFVLAAIAYDLFSRRRLHPVYLWGGPLLAMSVPARLMISSTAAWRSVAEFLVGLAK